MIVKHGDKYPVTFTANMDLSTATTVTLSARAADDSVTILASTVTDAANGVITHVLTGTLPVGEYEVSAKVTFADGSIMTFPGEGFIRLIVEEDIE